MSAGNFAAADSSYLQLTETGATLLVRSTDGTQLTFADVYNEYRCTQVKDRNGNYLSINYDTLGHITNISDTLGRVIVFNYDSNANLLSITQSWNGQPSHQWVSFGWSTRNMQYSFSNDAVIGTAIGAAAPVITQVALNDTSYFTFDYTNSLQVSAVRNYFGTLERNATTFTYETPAGDVPRLLSSSESAHNWSGFNGVPAQVTTQYSVAGDGACVLTAPDGTIYKEYYGTGWQKGLPTQTEVWSGGVRQKWTTTAWTQDNTSVSYEVNPRVTETNVYDAGGNRRRVVIDYGQYAQYGLPYAVHEYAADGINELRQTVTDYNLGQAYLDRRIIGLVSEVQLKNGSQSFSKTTYSYDDPARLQSLPASATQHDAAYSTSLTARGNVTAISRWDVSDINNAAKRLTSYSNYFTTGTPASITDPAGHQSSVAYADGFSDSVNRNTFAYPTTLTDADGYSSYVQYNFDFGATTRSQSPAPAGQSQGAIQTMTYNSLGQLERITTTNNGAYKRFWYGAEYTANYATVNNLADEAYSIQVTDGLGRVIGAVTNHPGSTGGYSLINTVYDQMGRAWLQSNPTEVNSSWVTSGDDSAGIYYTQQTYDWKGRPLVTTNPDLTTKQASYSGCGCAGGEVVTLTDEGTINGGVAQRRQQRIYSDVLGRTVKTELLNWQGGTVYSSTVNVYNAQDQVEQIRQYAGAEGSATYQTTTLTYDGYGRLQTRHLPEQSAGTATTWDYNADDTIQAITDARGAATTFTYNNGRHLPTSVAYALAGSSTSTNTFVYDAVGNRTKMTDGLGEHTYQYNQLSQITQEKRAFPVGAFYINYSYNLAGQLSSVTDPFGASFAYQRDAKGQLKAVAGSAYAGVTSYVTDVNYRAWGAAKSVSYNGNHSTIAYDSRLQPTQFRLTVNGTNTSVIREDYAYFNDGTLAALTDLDDTAGNNPPVTLRFLSRAFNYDQAGRITSGFGAGNAGEGVPFSQNYSYDPFGNMTGRSSSYYNYNFSAPTSDTAAYANNRRSNWSYDNEGQVTSTPLTSTDRPRTMTYDPAGRMVSNVETEQSSTTTYTASYDGDGEVVYESTSTSPGASEASFIVHSTVLGGEALTRLDQSGNKKITHVPAGGLLFATQSTSISGPFVTMTQRNPLGTTETNKAVYDPLGNYIPFQAHGDPRPPAGSYTSASAGTLSASLADPYSPALGCLIDGLPTNCNRVLQAINRGEGLKLLIDNSRQNPNVVLASLGLFLVEQPVSSSRPKTPPKWRPQQPKPSPGNPDPYHVGRDETDWAFTLVSFQHPPNQGRLSDAELDILRNDLNDHLHKRKDCIDFVRALLLQVALNTGREAILDPLTAFDEIRKQGAVAIDPTITHPAEAWGALSTNPGNPATIKVLAMPFGGHSWTRGDLILGEVLHLAAKKGVYSDSDLAWAGYQVTWGQGYRLQSPPITGETEANSRYFHNQVQFAACNPYQRK